jgi:integrase
VHKHRRELVPLKGKKAGTALLLPGWWGHHQHGAKGRILTDLNGTPVHPSRYWELRAELLRTAGLEQPGRGYHIDRHTYARDFIELGGRFEELQKSLRHRSIRTTEELYGHFLPDVAASLARERIYGKE